MGRHRSQPIRVIAMWLRRRQKTLDFSNVRTGVSNAFVVLRGKSRGMKNDRRMRVLSVRRGGPFGEAGSQSILFETTKSDEIALMAAFLHLDDEIIVRISHHMHVSGRAHFRNE